MTVGDIRASGGMLHFDDRGTAGCVRCGWKGVPTIVAGERSTYCPSCELGKETMLLWYGRRRAGSPLNQRVRRKVPRNAPCTCGSGRKFKRCCGRPT